MNPKEARIKNNKKLLKRSGISIVLENYDDLFSDFDPRPYTHRSLSDDFLAEIRRASLEKPIENLELKFLLPTHERKITLENTIKNRLMNHFVHHYNLLAKEKFKIIRNGSLFMFSGILIMLITSYLLFKYHDNSLGFSFLIVLLEPAGWFSFWEGLNIIFFETKSINPEYNFYKKMSTIKISFWTY